MRVVSSSYRDDISESDPEQLEINVSKSYDLNHYKKSLQSFMRLQDMCGLI